MDIGHVLYLCSFESYDPKMGSILKRQNVAYGVLYDMYVLNLRHIPLIMYFWALD